MPRSSRHPSRDPSRPSLRAKSWPGGYAQACSSTTQTRYPPVIPAGDARGRLHWLVSGSLLACLRLFIGLSPALYWLVSGSLTRRLYRAAAVPRLWGLPGRGGGESRQQPSSGAHCQSRSSPLRVRRRKGDTTPRGTGAPHSKWSPRRTEAAAPRPTRDMQAVGAPQSARPRMSSNPHSPAPHE